MSKNKIDDHLGDVTHHDGSQPNWRKLCQTVPSPHYANDNDEDLPADADTVEILGFDPDDED